VTRGPLRACRRPTYPHNPQEQESGAKVFSDVQLEDFSMTFKPDEAAIDEIVASCDGDLRGALKALLLVNEQLEAELQYLYGSAVQGMSAGRGKAVLH
jgi:hypothetical protein